ncbi:MAG: hypothetical protein V4695_11905, partial [Pseudomonadota bacterium]
RQQQRDEIMTPLLESVNCNSNVFLHFLGRPQSASVCCTQQTALTEQPTNLKMLPAIFCPAKV